MIYFIDVVRLLSEHEDEKIEIEFECDAICDLYPDDDDSDERNSPDEGESEDELGLREGIWFSVRITNKIGELVKFKCSAGEEVSIEAVEYFPAGQKESSDVFGGPIFEDLEEQAQDAFYAYLEQRFVDADLSFFILTYSRAKLQQQYGKWASDITKFITKS